MALVGPQDTCVWGRCSASACAWSTFGGLRAAKTFSSKAVCDTCVPQYLYWRVQPAVRGLRFALCFVWGGQRVAVCPGQPNPVFVSATSLWGSHRPPSLARHCHTAGAEQPTAVGFARGCCLSSSEGAGCPRRPPAPPVRASPSPPRGGGTRACVSLMRLGLEQLCCWHRERGMERGR